MSDANVEVARRWHAAISNGLEGSLAAIEELCDPEIDFYPVRKYPEAVPCHGWEEFSRFFTQFFGAWATAAFGAAEVIPVGDDRVLVCGSLSAEGGGSGLALEGPLFSCCWVRHGRLIRLENHLTLKGALYALGLEGDTLEAAGLR